MLKRHHGVPIALSSRMTMSQWGSSVVETIKIINFSFHLAGAWRKTKPQRWAIPLIGTAVRVAVDHAPRFGVFRPLILTTGVRQTNANTRFRVARLEEVENKWFRRGDVFRSGKSKARALAEWRFEGGDIFCHIWRSFIVWPCGRVLWEVTLPSLTGFHISGRN